MEHEHLIPDPGQEQRLVQDLLNSLNVGYLRLDMDENILEVNDMLLAMSGATRDQLIGHNNREFYRPEEFARMQEIALPLQRDDAYQFEFVMATASGARIPVLNSSFINRDKHGERCSINVMVTDIRPLREREEELERVKREVDRLHLSEKMVGVSQAMQDVFDFTLRCAAVDSTVLVLGETGVGKEIMARSIHEQSTRHSRPFVAVNCGALPDTLLESELFGHVRGAFTGATSDRSGLFRQANGGTLFLDEVGDISAPMQVKLLRALQDRQVRPVGSDLSCDVDVRVIAATNRDLAAMASQEEFRRDLYYRLAVIPCSIPPLRERREDVLPLAEHLLRRLAERTGLPIARLDHAAQQALLDYAWPGNVRELGNALEYAVAMKRGKTIKTDDLPVQVVRGPLPPLRKEAELESTLTTQTSDAERDAIVCALRQHRGNRGKAAADLGISRTTLWRKITMHHIA